MNLCPPLLKQQAMLNHARPDPWVMSSRRGGRGRSSQIAVTVPADSTSLPATEHQVVPTLLFLSLRSVESSLGKGLATFSLRGLPLGLVETIYEFVFSRGSRMAQMEVSKSLAPLLFEHVMTLDFSLGGTKCLGDSALLELATGCDSGLVHLNLNACGFVTDAGILGTILRCPAIRSLSLSGCGLISDEVSGGEQMDTGCDVYFKYYCSTCTVPHHHACYVYLQPPAGFILLLCSFVSCIILQHVMSLSYSQWLRIIVL